MKKKLLYLFPSFLDHPGLKRKLSGQLTVLSKHYKCRLITLMSSYSHRKWHKILAYLRLTLTSLSKAKKADIIYSRYNAKYPLLFLALAKIADTKPVIIEINGDYDTELAYLNRKYELKFHRWTFKRLLCSKANLAITNTTLFDTIKKSHPHPKQIHFLQNGYMLDPTPLTMAEIQILFELKAKIEPLKAHNIQLAVLVSAVPSPRTQEMIQILSKIPNLKIVSVGASPLKDIPQISLHIPTIPPNILDAILPQFDLGISPKYSHEIGFTAGSVLKTCTYLASGLRVVTDYDDSLIKTSLSPYIYNIASHPNQFQEWLTTPVDQNQIKAIALKILNWEKTLNKIIEVAQKR